MEEKIVYHQRGKDSLYKIWHASKEHLLMYIYSDGGSIVCADKVFPIRKGALVFIAADTYHYTMPDDPQCYDRSKLTVLPQNLAKIAGLLEEDILSRTLRKAIVYAEIDERDRDAVDRIFAEGSRCEKEGGKELIRLSSLLQLLFFLEKYTVESTPVTAGMMSRAIQFINENISLDLDIDEICAHINVSKYHFCRLFKTYTGMTVMKYILKTRIILAKSELKKTSLSITEISEKFGFSSASYFCRVFKEEENCSPLQYRKRNVVPISR